MEIEILELLEGARKARGCTVIIDVFRAFSLEPFLLDQNAKELTAVETVETAWKMRKEDPDLILMGERHGRILDGFDYGNSPASIRGIDFTGKRIITRIRIYGYCNAHVVNGDCQRRRQVRHEYGVG